MSPLIEEVSDICPGLLGKGELLGQVSIFANVGCCSTIPEVRDFFDINSEFITIYEIKRTYKLLIKTIHEQDLCPIEGSLIQT